MGQIKDIACYERPREKALKLGINNLSDIELFALIIQSGGKNNSVLNIAYNLLDKSNGLSGFLEYDYEKLLAIKGINKVTAIKLLAIKELMQRFEYLQVVSKAHITNSKDIYKMFRIKYFSKTNEEILILLLNHANQIIKEEVIASGSINEVSIDFRLIFCDVLKNNVHKFILIHNHPTGDSAPSNEDIYYTNEIKKKAKGLGLKLLDHIIIGKYNYFSFKDNALI